MCWLCVEREKKISRCKVGFVEKMWKSTHFLHFLWNRIHFISVPVKYRKLSSGSSGLLLLIKVSLFFPFFLQYIVFCHDRKLCRWEMVRSWNMIMLHVPSYHMYHIPHPSGNIWIVYYFEIYFVYLFRFHFLSFNNVNL